MEEIELEFMEQEEQMEKAVSSYEKKLTRINTGRANPMILSSVKVDYFGSMMGVKELASISVSEGTQLVIRPYDHSATKSIVAAINNASLGVIAQNEGDKARINFPAMTTEKRVGLVKQMTTSTEEARVKIRQARQALNKIIKKNKEISEDKEKELLDDAQKLTDKFIAKIQEIKSYKEKELLEI